MNETAVLISIKPKWVNLILSGKKTIEVRKTVPKLTPPFTCYIYESGTGCVVGEFVCTGFTKPRMLTALIPDADGEGYTRVYTYNDDALKKACITRLEAAVYGNGLDTIGWHISSVKEYETPLPLSAFQIACTQKTPCNECQLWNNGRYQIPDCALANIEKPPQSWRYVQRRAKP